VALVRKRNIPTKLPPLVGVVPTFAGRGWYPLGFKGSNVFLKYIHIFIWFSKWGGGPTFVTGSGSISRLSGRVSTYTHTRMSALWTVSDEDTTDGSIEMSPPPQMMDRERSRAPFIAIPAPTAASGSTSVI
jgi:hypothetical protein